jgi:hypothetical protein
LLSQKSLRPVITYWKRAKYDLPHQRIMKCKVIDITSCFRRQPCRAGLRPWRWPPRRRVACPPPSRYPLARQSRLRARGRPGAPSAPTQLEVSPPPWSGHKRCLINDEGYEFLCHGSFKCSPNVAKATRATRSGSRLRCLALLVHIHFPLTSVLAIGNIVEGARREAVGNFAFDQSAPHDRRERVVTEVRRRPDGRANKVGRRYGAERSGNRRGARRQGRMRRVCW